MSKNVRVIIPRKEKKKLNTESELLRFWACEDLLEFSDWVPICKSKESPFSAPDAFMNRTESYVTSRRREIGARD